VTEGEWSIRPNRALTEVAASGSLVNADVTLGNPQLTSLFLNITLQVLCVTQLCAADSQKHLQRGNLVMAKGVPITT